MSQLVMKLKTSKRWNVLVTTMNLMKILSMKPASGPMSTTWITISRSKKKFQKENETKMMKMSLMLTKRMVMSDSVREVL